jgi:hypothetical protein
MEQRTESKKPIPDDGAAAHRARIEGLAAYLGLEFRVPGKSESRPSGVRRRPRSASGRSLPGYLELIERTLRGATATAWPRRIFLILLFMRSDHPDESERPPAVLATLAEKLLHADDLLRPDHAAGILLLIMGAV